MKPVAFGKVPVAAAGTPVQLGAGALAGPIGASDLSLTITQKSMFCADMAPFVLLVDSEQVEVGSYAPATGVATLVGRGVGGTAAAAHLTSAPVVALLTFSQMFAEPDDANTGKVYLGTKSLGVANKRGIIKGFEAPSGGTSDDLPPIIDYDGDRLRLTDYWIDAAVSGEGLIVTVWVI